MTGFEVYKMYLALKQHFTKPDYDFWKYNGKIRANEKSFEQMKNHLTSYRAKQTKPDYEV